MDTTIKNKELTSRELLVLKYICYPPPLMAQKMSVTEATIRSFKTLIRDKLNASNDVQILANALKRGVITLDEIEIVEIERD